ncbi:MAG: hypothetical protein QOI41_7129 [Myxococcales bacterium]|jgi:hypothetical protein|nr:hypothetical protein [Myxococcales bacterium]
MRQTSLASLAAVLVAIVAAGCSSADSTPIPSHKATTKTPTPAGTGTAAQNPADDLPAPAPATPAPTAGTEIGSESWADGKMLAASVTIKAGATVDIAPGATVTAASGVSITVKGTLSVQASASHAKLTGANWKGIIVASGGTLNVDGLDISNAEVGAWTQTGNTDATMLNSSISAAATPFKMEPGSKLTITKSSVVKSTGQSQIAGTFVASYMAYDKGSSEGLELNDAAGSMTISDSTLTGLGGGDYVVSRTGALVKVEYTTITGSHCGFHFNAVDKFIIDHVSDDQNSYGAMLYGSGAGPNQILSSNVRSTDKDLDFSGTNGATTIDKSFTGGKNTLATNAKITNAATVPVANAKPR